MQRRPLVVWAAARSRAAAQRTVAAEKAGGEAAQARRRVRAAAPSPMRRSVLRRREAQCLGIAHFLSTVIFYHDRRASKNASFRPLGAHPEGKRPHGILGSFFLKEVPPEAREKR